MAVRLTYKTSPAGITASQRANLQTLQIVPEEKMSLLPWGIDQFTAPYRPPRFWDVEDEFLLPWGRRPFPPPPARWPVADTGAQVHYDKDKFQVNIDVQQFAPNEITVKTSGDDTVIVEGKHEERPDEHGYISRQFTRRYVLPKGHDINQVVSNLSSDGVLTITAPKTGKQAIEQKTIPIQHTGKPSKPVQPVEGAPVKK